MALRRAIALAVVWTAGVTALEKEPAEIFQSRRQELAAKHTDGLILLFGYSEQEAYTTRSAFRQENNFYYLTGWNEPGAALALLPKNEENPAYREILFLPPRDAEQERWVGPRTAPDDPGAEAKTGFAEVRPDEALSAALEEAAGAFQRVYTLLPQQPSHAQRPEPDNLARVRELLPGKDPLDLRPSLTRMRMVKTEGEIRLIQKAVDATVEAHREAWRRIRPNLFEYQLMGMMMARMIDRGCLRPAYPPIIGAGFNSTVLHYSANSGPLQEGDLLLMDVGGEYAHYAADITRTVPVNGRFSSRQRAIYEAVLGAQEAVLDAVKPGMKLTGNGPGSLAQIARDYLDSYGKRLGGEPLSPHFLHGIGHYVGLEVHDPGSPHEPLKPGMVITVEPGLYLPEEGIGVRIEDMVLVTAEGARILSSALTREIAEIEAAMRKASTADR